jgi:hypothetical protein
MLFVGRPQNLTNDYQNKTPEDYRNQDRESPFERFHSASPLNLGRPFHPPATEFHHSLMDNPKLVDFTQ